MAHSGRRLFNAGVIGLSFLMLLGCKEVLFSSLEEIEANEMVAILAAAGLEATRERDKDNIYSVLVESAEIATATTLLRHEGYPTPKFESLGDVFSAESIVGTPFEQHLRYIHAMNEELSHTITAINGVKSARVFINSPTKGRYERNAAPASASVTINYEPGFDAQGQVSKIKMIVARSVANLEYEDVGVALFPTSGPAIQLSAPEKKEDAVARAGMIGSFDTNTGQISWVAISIGVLSLAIAAFLVLTQMQQRPPVRKDARHD